MAHRIILAAVLLLFSVACRKPGDLVVVLVVDPVLGPAGEARAQQSLRALATQLGKISTIQLRVASTTTGNFGQLPPQQWRDQWRATAVSLLPRHQANLLVVYLAAGQPAVDSLPFDNIAIVMDRPQPELTNLLTLWGVPPSEGIAAPGLREWLAAAANFPLDGGLTQWSLAKTKALEDIAARVPKPLGREPTFPLELAGKALRAAGQMAASAEVFAHAAALRPQLRLRLEQAAALRQSRQTREALALTQPLLSQYPNDPDLISEIALNQAELGQRDAAEKTLREGIERVPQNATLQTNLGGLIMEQLGRRAEGLALMQRAVQLDPQNSVAAHNERTAITMGRALAREADRLESVARQEPTGDNWRRLGIALARLGSLSQSEKAFRRAQALLPADVAIEKNLKTVIALQKMAAITPK